MKSRLKLIYLTTNAMMLWFALVLQFVISTQGYMADGRSLAGALIEILSFFTIQTNLLIAIALSAILLVPRSRWGRFFGQTSVLTAIAVYILIVGLVYAVVLKGIWQLQGLFKLADVLLHEVSPVIFLLYWLFFVPKEKLRWSLLFPWAIFPLLYLVYSLLRGAVTGGYPYPFINVAKLGYGQVMINSGGVLVVFLVFGALLIGVSRSMADSIK
ncbi:MAG: hypothetical protein EOP51_25450 [Sphingobacteriales bacterium]|nr:MAG: hypothetical protein EOP51_25450 [Sphingobacteriales bacterium]